MVLIPNEKVVDFCNGQMAQSTPKWVLNILDKAKTKIDEIDNDINKAVNSYMCKSLCPCVPVNFLLWDEPLRTDMKKTASSGGVYRFNGNNKSLLDCYESKKVIWESTGNPPLDTDKVTAIKNLENDFKCSGLCKSPNFWLSRDVTEGPPPNACIFNLKQRFNRSAGALAWTTTGTAFVIFLVFIVHYGLYLVDPSEIKNRKKKFIFEK